MTKQSPTAMTRAEVLALPALIGLWPTAAGVLGVGRTVAYDMVRRGEWPTRVLRLGSLIKVPTADLLELLGIAQDGDPLDRSAPEVADAAGPWRSRTNGTSGAEPPLSRAVTPGAH